MWPADPPPGYLGQLAPQFQSQLAGRWADVRLEDCSFYHSALLPDGSFIKGPWDLIDNERGIPVDDGEVRFFEGALDAEDFVDLHFT